MDRLKIAVVIGQFPTVSETFIINQIAFLKEAGHHVDILCLGKVNAGFVENHMISKYNLLDNTFLFKWQILMPTSYFQRLLKAVGILVKSVGTNVFIRLLNMLNPINFRWNAINCTQFFRMYYELYFLIKNHDVIHIHFADNAVSLLTQLTHFKKKIIVTFHGYDAHNFDKSYYKNLQQLENVIYTVNTQFTRDKVVALGFSESNITILPVGLDTTFFKPNKIAHDTFNILFIGRLIAFKAPLFAIKIIEKLIHDNYTDIHLNIIGEGEEYNSCLEYIVEKKLNKFVTLLGTKSQQDIIDYMNTSDVFLFPGIIDKTGRCENQGLVIQEAQAMKLPVIVSDVGGVKEGLVDRKTGFVVEENDIDGFVSCLIGLINNPLKKKEMGNVGRTFVVNKYDSRILGAQLLNIYGK